MKTSRVDGDPVLVEITHRVVSAAGTVVSNHDRLSDAQSMRDLLAKQKRSGVPLYGKGLRIEERREGWWHEVFELHAPGAP